MYVVMVYDVGVERVNRVLKIGRQHLVWVQNSVFEGEITPADFERLKSKVRDVINEESDSIIFYKLRSTKYFSKVTVGATKGEPTTII